MSTSIYKQFGTSFLTNTDKMIIYRSDVQKVKKVLFGPVDHAATKKLFEEEMKKIGITESKRWNFDFQKEKTLHPDGDYVWKPATPQKRMCPVKRRLTPEDDLLDCYARPEDIIRPIPQRAVQDDDMKSPPKTIKLQPQRLITEFMPVKKSVPELCKKKIKRSSSLERPSKRGRLSEFAS